MIYAGEWVDDDGHPWDRSAKLLQTWTGGGMGSVRRTGLVAHPSKAPFVAAARYVADRWNNELEDWMRDAWDVEGLNGAPRRGSLDRTPVSGYVLYNSFDFVQLYHDPPSVITGPSATWHNILATAINAVNVGAGTVTFTATADVGTAGFAWTRLVTYQVDPAAVDLANPWKATRLLDLADGDDVDPGPYNPTVPLAWPLHAGDTVRLYWRGRVASWWKYHDDDQVTA